MAFNLSGAGQGAAGGAMMGSTIMPGIGTGIGALAGGLLGAFGGGSKKGGTEIREFRPQWYQNPGSQGAYNSAWGNLQNQQEALSRGELPSYFQRYKQAARKQLSDPLARTYFGDNGSMGQGVLSRNFEAASQSGAGPKAAVAGMRKGLNDYAMQSQQIDFMLEQLGYDQFTRAQDQSMPITQNSGSWKMSEYLPITTAPQQGVGSQLLGMGMQGGGISSLAGIFGGGGDSGEMIPSFMGNNSAAGFDFGMGKLNYGNVRVPPQYMM